MEYGSQQEKKTKEKQLCSSPNKQRGNGHTQANKQQFRSHRTQSQGTGISHERNPQNNMKHDQSFNRRTRRTTARHHHDTSGYTGCWKCGLFNHNANTCYYDSQLQCRECYHFGHKAKYCELKHHHDHGKHVRPN